jgi:Ser/Thr protein kinase RdoA (MazF antagonist)
VQRISGIKRFTPVILDASRRALVESVLSAFEETILPVASTFRGGVLMSDWNDANIIVDPVDVEVVKGVIDFGDRCAWSQLDRG